MKIGLFIPRYVDAFFPEVGIATLQLLERLGCSVEYPLNQTCCVQPTANSGRQEDSAATDAEFPIPEPTTSYARWPNDSVLR